MLFLQWDEIQYDWVTWSWKLIHFNSNHHAPILEMMYWGYKISVIRMAFKLSICHFLCICTSFRGNKPDIWGGHLEPSHYPISFFSLYLSDFKMVWIINDKFRTSGNNEITIHISLRDKSLKAETILNCTRWYFVKEQCVLCHTGDFRMYVVYVIK